MRILKNHLQKFILIFYSVLLPLISFAEGETQAPCDAEVVGKIKNPLGCIDSIPDLIRIILEGALKIGIPIVALAIIYSGFLFVFARGNDEKLKTAKDALFYSIIGAAVLLGSWAIAEMIASTVNALK